MTSNQLSLNSEKYFIQKFTKEVVKMWQDLPAIDEASTQNETMSFEVYKDFLVRLGFDTTGDSTLEVWRQLGGEIRSIITLNNLRIFLLAIMGTFVEPGLNKAE